MSDPKFIDTKILLDERCVLCGKDLHFWQRQEHTYFIDEDDESMCTPSYYKVHTRCLK